MTQIKHGHAKNPTPTYRSWISMKARCKDPNATGYHRYGGIGVKVCERWLDFSNFLADMGERPPATSLGRIGDIGNYEPGNCEWQTRKQQAKRGSSNGRALLTEEQVLCVRSLYKPHARRGCSVTNMAADLGVGFHVIDQIVTRKTWRHI
jgi:hypothetical protein